MYGPDIRIEREVENMKNLFADCKYYIKEETEQRVKAILTLKNDFKDLYRVYSKYGDDTLLKTYFLQLQGKISILYQLDIITKEESRKLWNYTKLFARKYQLRY